MLGCVKEFTFVLYWPQFYESDVLLDEFLVNNSHHIINCIAFK